MGFSTERETKKMQANFNYRWPQTIRSLIKQFESDFEESLPVDMTSLKGPLAVARRGCGTALPVVWALWPYGPLTQLSFLRGTMYTRTALPEMLQCVSDINYVPMQILYSALLQNTLDLKGWVNPALAAAKGGNHATFWRKICCFVPQ